ncbi:MAG: N-acetylmuramoyl-L-alanine amidase [Defluviitaleaceae bacterium]|nr:N-acetylmuramoyl-L-alanine amidase [Defluviitaleaceae bacterium]
MIGLLLFAAIFFLAQFLSGSGEEGLPQEQDTLISEDFVQVGNFRIIDPQGLVEAIVFHPQNGTITLQHVFPIHEERVFNENSGFTYIRIYSPRDVFTGPVVIIDPGHGGNDIGAPVPGHPYIFESHIVLEIALRLYELFQQSNSGINAVMTRRTDIFVSPTERSHIGNTLGDKFVSIHTNTYDDPSVAGTETLFNSFAHPDSGIFAHIIQSHLVAELGTRDRGILLRNDLYALNTLEIPAVFVEVDFKTNPEALANLQNGAYQQRVAEALYRGIISSFNGD